MKEKSKLLKKIISASSLLTITFFMIILICVLIILDYFGVSLTKEKVQGNIEYAESYKISINKYLENGYVPLQRILYFYLEDNKLSFDALYFLNQDTISKKAKEIDNVCKDIRVKDYVACDKSNIKANEEYLVVSTSRFNFPLKDDYIVTSFYNEERIIYNEHNLHSGWDFATNAETPVFSVCDGVVEKVNFTQNENVSYEVSNNRVGNSITIKCNSDYEEIYYVYYAHLFPNSSKVNVGDKVYHWTEIASVGTTGYSTGNHLHYQVYNSNWELIDGMQLIDFTLSRLN